MFKLIGNENLKIYCRLRTWILLGIILVATILVAWVMTATRHQTNHLVLPLNGWTFAIVAEPLNALLIAFIVVIAGDIVASEFSSGTIKMLLTQTATRTQILASKYISAMLYSLLMTASLAIFSVIVGGIFFGFSGATSPYLYGNSQQGLQEMATVWYILMTYGFLFIQVIVISTIAFMISAIFRSSALAITISILAYFAGNILVGALHRFSWVKYILFANTNLIEYVSGSPVVPGMTLGFSVTILVVYYVVMIGLSWWLFVKRDVSFS